MTRRKPGQRILWEGMIDEDIRALWEPWMVQADRLLEDDELIERLVFVKENHEIRRLNDLHRGADRNAGLRSSSIDRQGR